MGRELVRPISIPQQLIYDILCKYITDIKMDYKHPSIFHTHSNDPIEIDIWIPSLNLGIEYHGQHHYAQVSEYITCMTFVYIYKHSIYSLYVIVRQ